MQLSYGDSKLGTNLAQLWSGISANILATQIQRDTCHKHAGPTPEPARHCRSFPVGSPNAHRTKCKKHESNVSCSCCGPIVRSIPPTSQHLEERNLMPRQHQSLRSRQLWGARTNQVRPWLGVQFLAAGRAHRFDLLWRGNATNLGISHRLSYTLMFREELYLMPGKRNDPWKQHQLWHANPEGLLSDY